MRWSCCESFLLFHLASGWSEVAFSGPLPPFPAMALDSVRKSRIFCLCCCMPLRISLTLEVKLFTVALVHGSVVLSTPDSHTALRGLGAVLFWKSQSKTIAIKWVCSSVSFVFHVRLVLVISSVEFLRRLVVGLNLGEEPSSGLRKSHVTPNPRLDTRLDLSLGLTQQLLSPCHSFTAFFSHVFGGQLLLPTGKLKGLSSSFPFSFSSLVVKSPACPSSTYCLPTPSWGPRIWDTLFLSILPLKRPIHIWFAF